MFWSKSSRTNRKFMTNETKNLIRGLGGAKHSLGQHFLTNEAVVRRMVETAQVGSADTVLEIGPGLGILTREILRAKPKKLIACELDKQLFTHLKDEIKDKNLKLINQNALLLIPQLIVDPPLKVISNLPYNISSPVIISLLSVCPTMPAEVIVMLQKEVAERLTAKPGDSNRGLLTVFIELFGETKIIEKLPRNFFYPPPEVDSAVLSIDKIENRDFEPKKAFKIIKLAFAKKRKKIKNSLFSSLKISGKEAQKIAQLSAMSLEDRPEDLDRDQWLKLIKILLEKIAD